MSKAAYQPDNYQSVIPYIHANNATKLMAFMKEVFDAKEIAVYPRPDGTIGHAAFRIGDSVVELADGGADWPPMPCALQVYVPDTDFAYQRALKESWPKHAPQEIRGFISACSGPELPWSTAQTGNTFWLPRFCSPTTV